MCIRLHVSFFFFFFSSRRRHTRLQGDWSSDVCSSDLCKGGAGPPPPSAALAAAAPRRRARPGARVPDPRRSRPPGAGPRASPSLVRSASGGRAGQQDDLAVAREVEPEAALGQRHEHGAALGAADAPLKVGPAALEVRPARAYLGELA